MNRFFLKSVFVILVFFLSNTLLFPQNSKRGNVWKFGFFSGLDFNSGTFPPNPISSAMSTSEGSASIANTSGQLLFYTDGLFVWDRNNNLMPNANGSTWNTSLSGDGSSTQSALITTFPCDTNKYYIFTTDGITCGTFGPNGQFDGLYYTVINMTLNGGMGDIDLAYLATQPGYAAGENKIKLVKDVQEKLTAAIHSNGIDYWIVVQLTDGSIYSYLVNCDGVETTPAISNQGSTIASVQGYIRASNDGKCIVVTNIDNTYVFDYDNNTGIASFDEAISTNGSFIPWDIAFSPNDSIFYLSGWISDEIRKYKRYVPNIASSEVIDNLSSFSSVHRIGPDGKLYIGTNGSLSVYNQPNNFTSPGFQANAVPITGSMQYGFPNFFTSYYSEKTVKLTQSDTTICEETPIYLGKFAEIGCNPTFIWSPTDGLDDATSYNPAAMPYQTTTYKVTATNSCTSYTDSITITVCDELAFIIPNVFTPNKDNINDEWTISSKQELNCTIYNRWGNLVHEQTGNKINWNGNESADGTYFYVLKTSAKLNSPAKEYKGYITLIR